MNCVGANNIVKNIQRTDVGIFMDTSMYKYKLMKNMSRLVTIFVFAAAIPLHAVNGHDDSISPLAKLCCFSVIAYAAYKFVNNTFSLKNKKRSRRGTTTSHTSPGTNHAGGNVVDVFKHAQEQMENANKQDRGPHWQNVHRPNNGTQPAITNAPKPSKQLPLMRD
jgi:hypothetical protein